MRLDVKRAPLNPEVIPKSMHLGHLGNRVLNPTRERGGDGERCVAGFSDPSLRVSSARKSIAKPEANCSAVSSEGSMSSIRRMPLANMLREKKTKTADRKTLPFRLLGLWSGLVEIFYPSMLAPDPLDALRTVAKRVSGFLARTTSPILKLASPRDAGATLSPPLVQGDWGRMARSRTNETCKFNQGSDDRSAVSALPPRTLALILETCEPYTQNVIPIAVMA